MRTKISKYEAVELLFVELVTPKRGRESLTVLWLILSTLELCQKLSVMRVPLRADFVVAEFERRLVVVQKAFARLLVAKVDLEYFELVQADVFVHFVAEILVLGLVRLVGLSILLFASTATTALWLAQLDGRFG